MPITVIVRSIAGDEPGLTFDGTQRVVIGRGAGSDVRVPDASVSHRHASAAVAGRRIRRRRRGQHQRNLRRQRPSRGATCRASCAREIGFVWVASGSALDRPEPGTRDLAMATRDLALAFVARGHAGPGCRSNERGASRRGARPGGDLGTRGGAPRVHHRARPALRNASGRP
jgi:hypothetical protein